MSESAVRDLLAGRLYNKLIWAGMKAVYSGRIISIDNWALTEIFYNSITRRTFTTVGVDPQIEFVTTDFEAPHIPATNSTCRTYRHILVTANLIERIVSDFDFNAPFADLADDARLVEIQLSKQLLHLSDLRTVDQADMASLGFIGGWVCIYSADFTLARIWSRRCW